MNLFLPNSYKSQEQSYHRQFYDRIKFCLCMYVRMCGEKSVLQKFMQTKQSLKLLKQNTILQYQQRIIEIMKLACKNG